MADVFISYSRHDRVRAKKLASRLEKLGISVWIDEAIPSGTTFDRDIETNLNEALAVLVLWSPSSVASDWVRNEALVAKERDALVAVMLSPCDLPVAFRTTQYEPVFEWHSEDSAGWVKTLERVKQLVGRRGEIENLQKKRRVRAKLRRVLLWIGTLPVICLMPVLAAGYLLRSNQVVPSDFYFNDFKWEQGYFDAGGAWQTPVPELAPPENYAQISCRRDENICEEIRGQVQSESRSLYAFRLRLDVQTWSDSTIVASDNSECGARQLAITRVGQSIVSISELNPERGCTGFMVARGRMILVGRDIPRDLDEYEVYLRRQTYPVLAWFLFATLLVAFQVVRTVWPTKRVS